MSRYLVDGRSLQDGSAVRGIGTYLRGLLDGYRALGVADHVSLLLQSGAGVRDAAAADLRVHPVNLLPLTRHLRPMLDPLQVRRALSVQPPDLYHAIEYAQPLLPPVPVVITVHDLIPFVMPHHYPWMHRELQLARRQLRHADAVIAVSKSTASDLVRLANVDPTRITVIHEGVAPARRLPEDVLAEVRLNHNIPEHFVLAVGTFDPRKRVDLLADVVRRVRVAHDVGLVIAGHQGNFATAVAESLSRAGLTARTRVLGHVSGQDLAALYQMAQCLVFTSAYEGFGLPPLEAMAAGTPAAVFDNSSLREVAGDGAIVIEDGDARAMADAVSDLLGSPAELQRRIAAGRKRAAALTWPRTAEETIRVYARVLARGREHQGGASR